MPDIMSLFDSNFLHAWDLPPGKDITATIEKVEGGELVSEGKKKSRKPVITFKGKQKKLALNKTNTNLLIRQLGRDYSKWPGRLMTMYGTTCDAFGDKHMPCIRVRPRAMASTPDEFPDRETDARAREMAQQQSQAAQREPGSDDR